MVRSPGETPHEIAKKLELARDTPHRVAPDRADPGVLETHRLALAAHDSCVLPRTIHRRRGRVKWGPPRWTRRAPRGDGFFSHRDETRRAVSPSGFIAISGGRCWT